MSTLLTEIEACLNSRPLTLLLSDPNDLEPLTPSHFFIGNSRTALGDRNYTETPNNRLPRWQRVQQIKQHFWNRWSKE